MNNYKWIIRHTDSKKFAVVQNISTDWIIVPSFKILIMSYSKVTSMTQLDIVSYILTYTYK